MKFYRLNPIYKLVISWWSDRLYGQDGDDYLCGGTDKDLVYGNNGSDVVYGEGANDKDLVYGDNGNYSSSTGNLFYNENGAAAGLGSGGHFATLENAAELFANDFKISN